jgi:hypothetical protein
VGANCALITGAGISADPPANLPLGSEFGDRILHFCYVSAARFAPDAVDYHGLSRVAAIPRNLLPRLVASAGGDSVGALLECFRVPVPTEAHLLSAVHGVRGTLHVTLNFDDGVEQAYALLAGTADLPQYAPTEYRAALWKWQHAVRPDAPLMVASSELANVDYQHRPLLVKLRGSVGTGFDPGLLSEQPTAPDGDQPVFSKEQLTAVVAAAQSAHVVVAGVSGADIDCRQELIPLLSRGRFTWTASELPAGIAASLGAIDPSQPVLRPALDGLRQSLPERTMFPAWPRIDIVRPRFDDRFAAWQAQFPIEAAAEAYASLLCDAGLAAQALPILRRLVARHDHPRTHGLISTAVTTARRDRDPAA